MVWMKGVKKVEADAGRVWDDSEHEDQGTISWECCPRSSPFRPQCKWRGGLAKEFPGIGSLIRSDLGSGSDLMSCTSHPAMMKTALTNERPCSPLLLVVPDGKEGGN
jgi:hypothetical protein